MIQKELHSIKSKADRLKFICEKGNREELLAEKKAAFGINQQRFKTCKNGIVQEFTAKSSNIFGRSPIQLADDEALVVVNSVGFMDSHLDVSMKGSWNKSIAERGSTLKPLLDHEYVVRNLYAQNKQAMIIDVPIVDLGYNSQGTTEVFAVHIKLEDMEVLDMYQKNMLTEHSAGLQYVNIKMAVNDERDEEGFAEWQKARGSVINGEMADEYGFFYPVYEQKAIEPSAVVMGSNPYTPAYTNISLMSKNEPSTDTQVKSEPIIEFFRELKF